MQFWRTQVSVWYTRPMTRAVVMTILAVCGILYLQALVLHFEGHSVISASGYVMFWAGNVKSPENSQQLSDWYTFSHIIHGFIFYFFLWLLLPRLSLAQRLVIAVAIESGWEMLENTPWLINHYREQTLAQGYFGDSIINSLSDSLASIFGFLLAARLPALGTLAVALALEIFVGYEIRDNLTLNILNFFHHFDFIARWQSGN